MIKKRNKKSPSMLRNRGPVVASSGRTKPPKKEDYKKDKGKA